MFSTISTIDLGYFPLSVLTGDFTKSNGTNGTNGTNSLGFILISFDLF